MKKNIKTPISYHLDWSDLAFGSKKPLKELNAIFIAAPREISARRFAYLIKQYFPQGNIVLGLSKEPYVLGLEGQPQFCMFQLDEKLDELVQRLNAANPMRKIYTLRYSQRDLPFVLEKGGFQKVVFVNGSWYRALHFRPEYYVLAQNKVPYEQVSPFTDEDEAKSYLEAITFTELPASGHFSELEMLELASAAAAHSFDYGGFQTATALGRSAGDGYELIATSHNKVVPYETYAMHFGSVREKNLVQMHDQNHYDTVHAEVALLVKAQRDGLDLAGTTLFINLLPCPSCAKMLTEMPIAEVVYVQDHSEGYAVQMLEKAGKKVRRVVPAP